MSEHKETSSNRILELYVKPKKKKLSPLEHMFALCDIDTARRARENERRNLRNISFHEGISEAEKLLLMGNVRASIRTDASGYTDRIERKLRSLQQNDPSPKVRGYADVLLKTGADREGNNKLFMDILLEGHNRFDIYPHTRKEKVLKEMLKEARQEMGDRPLPVMRSARRLGRTRFVYDPRL